MILRVMRIQKTLNTMQLTVLPGIVCLLTVSNIQNHMRFKLM